MCLLVYGCSSTKETIDMQFIEKLSNQCLDYDILISIPIGKQWYLVNNTDFHYFTFHKKYNEKYKNYQSFLNEIFLDNLVVDINNLPKLAIKVNNEFLEQFEDSEVEFLKCLEVEGFTCYDTYSINELNVIYHKLFLKGFFIIQDNYSGFYHFEKDYECLSYPELDRE